MFPLKKFLLPLVIIIFAASASAQIAPGGDTVIQSPTGVYYFFHAEGTGPHGATFIYANYSTHELDAINPSVTLDGHFSGVSIATGRTITGLITSSDISFTYNGVSKSGAKESSYGPTRRFAGEWVGNIQDPNSGGGYGEAIITSHGVCFVISNQDFFSDVGVGTIDSNGNVVVPLFTGRTLSGNFAPINGVAEGSFALSTGGSESYTVVRAIPSRLFNISTRGLVGLGEQVLIGGFIITDGAKTVVIRAIGPSLAQFGVANPVQSTQLSVYLGGQQIASNNGWQNNANASEITAGGCALSDTRESAIQVSLEPGAYTVIVSSADTSIGVGLVEVYGVGNTGGP